MLVVSLRPLSATFGCVTLPPVNQLYSHDMTEAPVSGIAVGGWRRRPHRGIYVALVLASMALLTLEVAFTRFFSFTVWYHLAYLTISVALLGFGSSGAIVASFPALFERHGHRIVLAGLVCGGFVTLASLWYLATYPLEITELSERRWAFSGMLLSYYAATGLPFLLAGFAIVVPFSAYPSLMSRLYFWDLLGAAAGCLAVPLLVEWLSIPGLIIAAAGLIFAAGCALNWGIGRKGTSMFLLLMASSILIASPFLGRVLPIKVTSTKLVAGMSDNLNLKDSYSQWTALNRVDATGWVNTTKMQFWGGIGIMQGYDGPLPSVGRVTYDGHNGSNIYSFRDDFEMLDHHILRTPYMILDDPEVLAIGIGGGIDMINAVKQGAKHVTGVELQPKTIYLLKEHLRDFTGGFYDRPDVTLLAGEGRHYIRKSNEVYDLIQITAVDTFAAQVAGAYVLAESYLYTVEAVQDYLSQLNESGLVSIVVGDPFYPDTLLPLGTRMAVTAYRALERNGVENPSDHLMVVGSPTPAGDSVCQVVLIKKEPLLPSDINTVTRFAKEKGFDVLYAPDQKWQRIPQLATLLGDDEAARQQAIEDAWFQVDAVHDDDPFFYNVGRWSHFLSEKSMAFLFPGSYVGQLVLALMVVQSLILGSALIVAPLLFGARQALGTRYVASYLAYFLALGVGFMFIEISFIQYFVLFLGSPTYALSVTIFSLLLFTSLGSILSQRFTQDAARAVSRAIWILAGLILVYAVGLEYVFAQFLHLDFLWRCLIAIVVQVPLGLTLGLFMPLGIALVSRERPQLVPWAWGINGVGSVLGTTLAVILAMSWGFKFVAACAAALYLIGGMLIARAGARAAAE